MDTPNCVSGGKHIPTTHEYRVDGIHVKFIACRKCLKRIGQWKWPATSSPYGKTGNALRKVTSDQTGSRKFFAGIPYPRSSLTHGTVPTTRTRAEEK